MGSSIPLSTLHVIPFRKYDDRHNERMNHTSPEATCVPNTVNRYFHESASKGCGGTPCVRSPAHEILPPTGDKPEYILWKEFYSFIYVKAFQRWNERISPKNHDLEGHLLAVQLRVTDIDEWLEINIIRCKCRARLWLFFFIYFCEERKRFWQSSHKNGQVFSKMILVVIYDKIFDKKRTVNLNTEWS